MSAENRRLFVRNASIYKIHVSSLKFNHLAITIISVFIEDY